MKKRRKAACRAVCVFPVDNFSAAVVVINQKPPDVLLLPQIR
jgi:hypothetical protein